MHRTLHPLSAFILGYFTKNIFINFNKTFTGGQAFVLLSVLVFTLHT
jgi:hypothetical protein